MFIKNIDLANTDFTIKLSNFKNASKIESLDSQLTDKSETYSNHKSPQRLSSQPYIYNSDIWSLGIMFYYLLE